MNTAFKPTRSETKLLESNEITYETIIKNYCSSFKQVADFLEKYYPFNCSFVEISLYKALIQLRLFLASRYFILRIMPLGTQKG